MMATPQRPGIDHDFDRGYRDGRMDALLPRAGAGVPADADQSYRAGYEAGAQSVRQGIDRAA
jgi:hypothetical protein